jgi:upstream activation factor subunit UAF30
MPAKKAAKKAAAKKEAPEKEIQAVEPQASAAPEVPAKKAAKKAAAKKEAAPKAEKSTPKPPKEKDVAKAAYLNYLDRKAKGLPGDQDSDWHAAVGSE